MFVTFDHLKPAEVNSWIAMWESCIQKEQGQGERDGVNKEWEENSDMKSNGGKIVWGKNTRKGRKKKFSISERLDLRD